MTMPALSVYIIAYNEADKIRDAITSVLWADEIVVADSHSTDGTADIAASLGARVVQIDFTGFGELRNQAMAACSHNWIFSLDADERCTPAARDEILAIITDPDAVDAYFIPRRNYFMGRWLKHSGFYPDYRQPQLFRKGVLVFHPDPVHEAYDIHSGRPAGYLKNDIWQIPYKNLGEIVHKVNKYSTLGAQKMHAVGKRATPAAGLLSGIWEFFKVYVLKLGILDGWAGFLIALTSFEVTFYKYAKGYELKAGWRNPTPPSD